MDEEHRQMRRTVNHLGGRWADSSYEDGGHAL